MAKQYKEDIDRYFDYSCYVPSRYLYIGSTKFGSSGDDDGWESGVDAEMAEYAIKGITYLESIARKPITIFTNNLGGSWYHGMAIYDTIRASRCHITMVALGYACSMGSIILQAADTRVLGKHCVFMIHDGTELLDGHTRTVERWAKESPKMRKRMYEIYRERMRAQNPKITIGQIEKLCSFDTIYDAQEAVDAGFADWVLEDMSELKKFTATGTDDKWRPSGPTGKHEINRDD